MSNTKKQHPSHPHPTPSYATMAHICVQYQLDELTELADKVAFLVKKEKYVDAYKLLRENEPKQDNLITALEIMAPVRDFIDEERRRSISGDPDHASEFLDEVHENHERQLELLVHFLNTMAEV